MRFYAEGNMETIAKTILINISKTPDVMENVFVGADCSPKEIKIYIDLLKNSATFLLGLMKKCQALIQK
jgi:hypothetical protein